ncbi:MAG: flagellum-specific ATP synthase FliI, partial [Rhodoferax sp.]|nr:flagellum-specific ATP synthase FliI [Rhodoferax sp.]
MPSQPEAIWRDFLEGARQRVSASNPLEVRGTLTRLTGLVLEATGIRVPVGSQCLVAMTSQLP